MNAAALMMPLELSLRLPRLPSLARDLQEMGVPVFPEDVARKHRHSMVAPYRRGIWRIAWVIPYIHFTSWSRKANVACMLVLSLAIAALVFRLIGMGATPPIADVPLVLIGAISATYCLTVRYCSCLPGFSDAPSRWVTTEFRDSSVAPEALIRRAGRARQIPGVLTRELFFRADPYVYAERSQLGGLWVERCCIGGWNGTPFDGQ